MLNNNIVAAVVAVVATFFITGLTSTEANRSNAIFELPALISRLDGLEGRSDNLRRDITEINKLITTSPTINELAKEVEALDRRQLESIADIKRLENKLNELEVQLAIHKGLTTHDTGN